MMKCYKVIKNLKLLCCIETKCGKWKITEAGKKNTVVEMIILRPVKGRTIMGIVINGRSYNG